MGFSANVRDEVLVRCGRHCCLCGKYAGLKIELHHIKQVADGGDDSADNCIPLCLDCHAEVKAYNPHHPKGRKFTERELKGHRDKCCARYSSNVENSNKKTYDTNNLLGNIFPSIEHKTTLCWGYPKLDKVCQLNSGDMVLVAGYTGMQKSAYLHHIVNFNIQRGQRVAYCCLKDNPFDVGLEIIAENAQVNVKYIRHGMATEEDWKKIENSQNSNNNLVLLPYDSISDSENVLFCIENSGAEMVVIDDFNGINIDDLNALERFLYQAKNTAAKSNTTVFVIYNLNIPTRMDKRPMLRDFPSDCYYRLFDVIQLLYKPAVFYPDDYENRDKDLEVIVVKGALNNPYIIEL